MIPFSLFHFFSKIDCLIAAEARKGVVEEHIKSVAETRQKFEPRAAMGVRPAQPSAKPMKKEPKLERLPPIREPDPSEPLLGDLEEEEKDNAPTEASNIQAASQLLQDLVDEEEEEEEASRSSNNQSLGSSQQGNAKYIDLSQAMRTQKEAEPRTSETPSGRGSNLYFNPQRQRDSVFKTETITQSILFC